MKKVLLASTALAFSAGVAAADTALSGSAQMGVQYNDSWTDEMVLFYQIDFGLSGSGETDGGLTFGASLDIDATIDRATGNQNSTPGNQEDFDPEVFISGAFGTLTVGNVDVATDPTGIADVGLDGIGIDNIGEAFRVQGSANVVYEYDSGGFGIAVSYHTINEDFGILATYDAGMFDVGLGYAEANGGADAFTLDVNADVSGVALQAFYTDAGSTGEGYGVSAGFDAGGVDITVAASSDTSDNAFGVGFSYDLGGGASLKGGIGEAAGNTVADFGVNMSF